MRYAIRITTENQPFIAALNEGVVPKIEGRETFFVIGNNTTPNEILSQDDLVRKYGTNYEGILIEVFAHNQDWQN